MEISASLMVVMVRLPHLLVKMYQTVLVLKRGNFAVWKSDLNKPNFKSNKTNHLQ